MPMGKPQVEWSYGDIEAGFKNAALVLDETFSVANNQHHVLEPRTALGTGRTASSTCTRHAERGPDRRVDLALAAARAQGRRADHRAHGGGFGSRATGSVHCMIPALLSKKAARR